MWACSQCSMDYDIKFNTKKSNVTIVRSREDGKFSLCFTFVIMRHHASQLFVFSSIHMWGISKTSDVQFYVIRMSVRIAS